ncbi:SAM-dependent methyltransferase [Aeromicrobium sp. A1-2]|uniref:class I SAM-dependent methyltransferase n=1 Tax=Aeromicrobium sp. A1-2 TaxID=2107713 RepID=UPI000E4E9BD3|nr:class I SAM-dependent methyltransferase [Aeromicrobium sp. A1-2]AXT85670.1 SAM-dependent methyltransferase [Aeromicrobium sp. A1-2]
MTASDADFVGEIPDLYDRLLVPMIFQGAADLLADAVARIGPDDVLETAAGTGALTRAMVDRMPRARITATDLNPPMLERARQRIGDASPVQFQQASALALPFPDDSFDVVACQFGVMFFPDRIAGHREARRVLRPGGHLAFNVWDDIEHNEIAHVVEAALIAVVPDPALSFMSRTPHGYADPDLIRSDVESAGFTTLSFDPVESVSRTTAEEAALVFCQGTPLRGVIEKQGGMTPVQATAIATEALLARYGPGPIEGSIRSYQIMASAHA